jgi:hypothetical protein
MNVPKSETDLPPLLFDLGPRDSTVIRVGTTIAIAFILIFGSGYAVKHLVLADPPNTGEAAFGLAVLAFFFTIACLLRFTTTAIVLADGRLHAVERLAFFKLVRSRPLEDIVRIETRFDEAVVNGRPLEGEHRLGALRIVCAERRRLTTAVAYPASALIPLATELASACEARSPQLGRIHLAETHGGATVVSTEPAPPPRRAPAEAKGLFRRPGPPRPVPPRRAAKAKKPRLRVTQTPEAITLVVPPLGLLRSMKGLLGFALFWNTIVGLGALIVFFPNPSADHIDTYDPSIAYLPLAIFALIGLGLTIFAIHLARQRAVFSITATHLRLATRSPFHRRNRLIARDQLLAVRVAPSHFHANNVYLNELKIVPVGENAIGLLKQISDAELVAIANFLTDQLGVTTSTTSRTTGDHPFFRRVA